MKIEIELPEDKINFLKIIAKLKGIDLNILIKNSINDLINFYENSTSRDIENEILENLAQKIRNTIKQEILGDTKFLAKLNDKISS